MSMWAGHPILNEIKAGIKLRPTKTVDKSQPFFKAEGEDELAISPLKKGIEKGPRRDSLKEDEDDSGLPSSSASTARSSSPAPSSSSPLPSFSAPPPIPSGKVPPPPPPPSNFPPPPPPPGMGPPPPPPPSAAPTTRPAPSKKAAAIASKFSNLGGKNPETVDRGALLKGIQGGFKLRKVETRDASAPILDVSEVRSDLTRDARPAQESYLQAPESNSFASSAPCSRESTPLAVQPHRPSTPEIRKKKERTPPKPSDIVFDEMNLRVTKDDLEKEIKKGTAAAAAARFMANVEQDSGRTSPFQAGTWSRSTTSGRLQSPFARDSASPSPGPVPPPLEKKPSKWAPVETGGLRRPTNLNTPHERRPSPSPSPQPSYDYRSKTPTPLSVDTTSSLTTPTPPQAFVTPPTPGGRNGTPPRSSPPKTTGSRRLSGDSKKGWYTPSETSPVSSEMSAPSPSSISPGRSSPKISNPNFAKAKNAFTSSATDLNSPVSSETSAASPSSVSPGRSSPKILNPNFAKAKNAFTGSASELNSDKKEEKTGNGLPAPRAYFLRNTLEQNKREQEAKAAVVNTPSKTTTTTGVKGKEKTVEKEKEMGATPVKKTTKKVVKKTSTVTKEKEKDDVAKLKTALNEAVAKKKALYTSSSSSCVYNADWRQQNLFNPYTIGRDVERELRENAERFRFEYQFKIDVANETPLSLLRRDFHP